MLLFKPSRWLGVFLAILLVIINPGSTQTSSCESNSSGYTFINTILVIATDEYNAETITGGLDGYGIPHQTLLVPKAGAALPKLNETQSHGQFGGIVVVGEVGYQYPDGWYSALKSSQWDELFEYQATFGVRMVRVNVYPTAEFGTTTAILSRGCCEAGVEQLISITDDSAFPTANINTDQGVSSKGLWHYPVTITNSTIATEFAQFAPAGDFTTATTAAIINDYGDRQQMVWFISWAIQWSATSNFLQHAYIHWMTRGLFVGKRKTYLAAQIDDMHLATGLYHPKGKEFRTRPEDIEAHKTWQVSLNSRLPAGSNFFLEIAHNGNGDLISATVDPRSDSLCDPDRAVDYPYPPDTPLEFKKPLGSGTDLWDPQWISYNWTLDCIMLDPLADWFAKPSNRDAFGHLSHTFTHQELNNATYSDASKEIIFNQAWLAQMGMGDAAHFSAHGLVPPAITGLHNGDVIRAWMENGIYHVVGDNTRAKLKNPVSSFWPRYSDDARNGHAGLLIIPRFATTIYYNCDTAECTLKEWIDTSGGSGDFDSLLEDARISNTRYLLGLHHDPYMFHQANMRHIDMPSFTVGDQTGQMSLVQIWVEVVAQEMARLTKWPIITLKHDDIAKDFADRMKLDKCKPNIHYKLSTGGKSISSITVKTDGNTCDVPVPVTLPAGATVSGGSARDDQVGSEPLIKWITMSGNPVEITLSTPVDI